MRSPIGGQGVGPRWKGSGAAGRRLGLQGLGHLQNRNRNQNSAGMRKRAKERKDPMFACFSPICPIFLTIILNPGCHNGPKFLKTCFRVLEASFATNISINFAKRFTNVPKRYFAPANLQKCVGGVLLYKFWRIFPGIFLEDFSGTFSHKNGEKKSGEKIREKIRRPKNKNPRKIRSAESRP